MDNGVVAAATGFGPDIVPAEVTTLAQTPRGVLSLPWGDEAQSRGSTGQPGSRMLMGRVGDDGFSPEEIGLLRGMAQC